MAASKVSALTPATEATSADLLYVVDGTTSKSITFDNLQKSIATLGPAAGVVTQGPVTIPVDKYFYIGDATTDGSWRFYISSTDLVFERRESGSWTEKNRMTA